MRGNRFFFLAPWGVLVALLVAATATTRSLGFHVWALHESRNWLWILKAGPGIEAARVHWQIDHRNPLSPWWYIALRPFFENVEPAFIIMQLLMGPALGGAVYLLIGELTGRKAPLLAAAAGILTSLFLVGPYYDGVIWNFVGALVASVLTVWAYLRSTRDGASWLAWRALSVLFWLIAIATYTLQCGAVIAIAILALARAPGPAWARVRAAMFATLPYAVTFVGFLALWKRYDTGVLALPLEPSFDGLIQSIGHGLWRRMSPDFWVSISSLSPVALGLFFLGPALAAAAVLRASPLETKDGSFSGSVILPIAIVACSLVAPTIALEASSDVWRPGTRWPMVSQFWTPLLVLTLLAVALNVIKAGRVRRTVFIGVVSVLAGCASLAYAGMNRFQVRATSDERAFFAGLRNVVEEDVQARKEFPRHYIVNLEAGGYQFPSDNFSARSYTDTLFPDLPAVTYRYPLADRPASPILGPGGVSNVSPFFAEVPYSRVERLGWDGVAFKRLPLQ